MISTYRLHDVGEPVESDNEHFWRNGHSVQMIVFDDSSPANQEKYYSLLEQTETHNELYYVGPREKEQFQAHLNARLRDKRLEGLVKNLFRPSYGGNRNYTLMSSFGGLMNTMRSALAEKNLFRWMKGCSAFCNAKLANHALCNETLSFINRDIAEMLHSTEFKRRPVGGMILAIPINTSFSN